MGCTQSVAVNPNKIKPLPPSYSEQIIQNNHIILGQIENNKYYCAHLILPTNINQQLQIKQISLPQLIANKNTNKQQYKLPNYSQLLCIPLHTSLYILTGGINYKLDNIYDTVYVYNSNSNKIYKLAEMKQARYTHSSIFINGILYVSGGRYFGDDDTAILNSCQMLDMTSYLGKGKQDSNTVFNNIINNYTNNNNKWQQIASMNIKRCSHIMAQYNNKIYCIGGYTSQYQRSTIIQYYHINNNSNINNNNSKWISLNVQLPQGIQSCLALTNNNNNQFIILGGNCNSGAVNIVLTINLLQGQESIKSRKKLNKPRTLHKGWKHIFNSNKNNINDANISNNQQYVYILGGDQNMSVQLYKLTQQQIQQTNNNNNKNIKIINKQVLRKYYKNSQQFQALTSSSQSLYIPYSNQHNNNNNVQYNENDEIICIFGTNNQPFILQLNISIPYAQMHAVPMAIQTYALQGVIYLQNSKQYMLFGGISDSQQSVSKFTYLYHLHNNNNNNKNRVIAEMNISRYAFAYQLIGNYVYAIGGGSADEDGLLIILNKCERFNIKNINNNNKELLKWQNIADLPFGLISSMALNYNNTLYVFGGMKSNKQRCQNIFQYNQKQNKWQQLAFNFPFGLQASSIYQQSLNQYIIFGGRVVNGDTKSIWKLTFINHGSDCVFEEKGQMKQAKCLHHVFKPKHQDFIVVLGGDKQILSCYDEKNLKPIQSDVLSGMKQLFVSNLVSLNDKSLKNYTKAMKG